MGSNSTMPHEKNKLLIIKVTQLCPIILKTTENTQKKKEGNIKAWRKAF